MNRINLFIILFLGLMMACGEEERWQYATDNIPPGQVTNVQVENVPGGAVITYMVPNDNDLLYVKAVYRMSDGTEVEQKSSASIPRISVEGLGRAQRQTVQLICGDRSGNESAAYTVEIDPLDAPIYEILESVAITADFGGIRIDWENPLRENIVLTIYVADEYGRFNEIQNVYSRTASGRYNLRGFPVEERTFAVSVRDRWNNKTDRVSDNYIPLLEEKLDRLKFGRWNPPGIPYSQLAGSWVFENMFDGLLTEPGWSFPNENILPNSITINLGQMAKLNRLVVFQRGIVTNNSYLFSLYNVKRFQLYASPHPNVNQDFSTWLFMGDFESVKPSGGALGVNTDEDIAYASAGESYIIQDNSHVFVQYVRIHILETWSGSPVAQFIELEFFGELEKE